MFVQFQLFRGMWNWSGKVYAIIGAIVFYLLFRENFAEHDFVKLQQKEGSVKLTLAATILLVTLAPLGDTLLLPRQL